MTTILSQLLYSLKSVSCYINPEYSNPANFDQVMDIFATQSLSSSRIIESQFTNVLGNSSKYYWYSPSLLNDSASGIESAIVNNTIGNGTGYLFATLTASNATDSSNSSSTGTTTSDNGGGNGSGQNQSTNTSLAMLAVFLIHALSSWVF